MPYFCAYDFWEHEKMKKIDDLLRVLNAAGKSFTQRML